MIRNLLLWVLCQFVLLGGSFHCLLAILQGSPRADRYLRAFDQVLSVALGGDEDFMPSAKAWELRSVSKRWGMLQCVLDWLSPGHCKRAYDEEVAKRRAFMQALCSNAPEDI